MATQLLRTAADSRPARVLIVDDSVVARTVIARLIDASGRFVVAGEAGSAATAMAFLIREPVDFVLLDVAMPGLDGLTALPDLLALARGARIIVVSSSTHDGAATSLRALALGAADTLEKPAAADMAAGFGRLLIDRLSRLRDGRGGSERGALAIPAAPPRPTRPATDVKAFDIVVIGASTGGIHALGALLEALPPDFDQPILVTQHLPPSFIPYFASQLTAMSGRRCDIAEDRMRLRPGHLVLAPGDAHLRCVALGEGKACVRLSSERVASGCLPSVDPMFRSAAEVFGARVLAIVLSGMGRDGSEGARYVHAAGGRIVVQDEESSVVWGMPGAIAGLGLADAVLPPAAIGRMMVEARRG